jgi:hypothetical protein
MPELRQVEYNIRGQFKMQRIDIQTDINAFLLQQNTTEFGVRFPVTRRSLARPIYLTTPSILIELLVFFFFIS